MDGTLTLVVKARERVHGGHRGRKQPGLGLPVLELGRGRHCSETISAAVSNREGRRKVGCSELVSINLWLANGTLKLVGTGQSQMQLETRQTSQDSGKGNQGNLEQISDEAARHVLAGVIQIRAQDNGDKGRL